MGICVYTYMRRRKFSLSRDKSSTLWRTCLCSSADAASSTIFPPTPTPAEAAAAAAAADACIWFLCMLCRSDPIR